MSLGSVANTRTSADLHPPTDASSSPRAVRVVHVSEDPCREAAGLSLIQRSGGARRRDDRDRSDLRPHHGGAGLTSDRGGDVTQHLLPAVAIRIDQPEHGGHDEPSPCDGL